MDYHYEIYLDMDFEPIAFAETLKEAKQIADYWHDKKFFSVTVIKCDYFEEKGIVYQKII